MQAPFRADTNRLAPDVVLHNQTAPIENLKLVRFNQEEYYQITQSGKPIYFHTHSGKELANGDERYAEYLARYFLGDQKSSVNSITRVSDFNTHYKIINRFLPVYRVSFNRPDNMDVYVHTPTSRLGTMNNSMRKAYMWFFSFFHNWDFLGTGFSRLKTTVVFLFSSLVFITGLLGLWIYAINKKKYKARKTKNGKLAHRNRHRKFAVSTAIILLMFSFSGAYHALQKFEPYRLHEQGPTPYFQASQLSSLPEVLNQLKQPINKLSLVMLENQAYYRIQTTEKNGRISYIHTKSLEELSQGDSIYAIQRALALSGLERERVNATRLITTFENEYGFINKRLPVVKVDFDTPDKLSYFIEPLTGIPGAIVRDKNRVEALSFIFLHKYHFLDFMGKGLRDTIVALAALSVVIIAITGLLVFIKMKR